MARAYVSTSYTYKWLTSSLHFHCIKYAKIRVFTDPYSHHNYATLSQSIETLPNNIFVMLFIGFSIKCYPLNFVPQALDIPKHIFTPNQSNLLSFYTRRSQYLTIKKFKKSKTFFHFSALTCRIINKTTNSNFSENQYGRCSF